MPILPPPVTAPYPTVEQVLQLARARINDMELDVDGELLSDTQPYTVILLNGAWQRFQDQLDENGVELSIAETILYSVPICGDDDPATQIYVGWTQSWDGDDVWPTPVLPQDMIAPKQLWERQSGTTMAFKPMERASGGLISRGHYAWNQWWDWRQDAIYMIGANQLNDIRMRYTKYLPDLALAGVVPVVRSKSAMANYLCAEFAMARNPEAGALFEANGDKDTARLVNRTARGKQASNNRRRPYGRRGGWRR